MKFDFAAFKKFAECGLTLARSLAIANGISPAQADLWVLKVSAK